MTYLILYISCLITLKLTISRQKKLKKLIKFLPKKNIYKKKHGFAFPIYDLLSNLPQEDFNSKFVEKEVVYKIFNEHHQKKNNKKMQLWSLMALKQFNL